MQQHAQFSSFLALRCRRDGPNTGPAVRHAATAAMSAASTVQPAATVARSSARPGAGLPALTRSVHRAGAAAVAAGLVDDLVAGAPRPVRGLHRGGLPGRRQRDAGHAVAPGGLLRLGLRRTDVTRRWRVPARGRVVRAGQRVGGSLVVGGAAGLVVVGAGVRRGGVEVSHGLDDGARLRDARWEREGRRRGGGGLMSSRIWLAYELELWSKSRDDRRERQAAGVWPRLSAATPTLRGTFAFAECALVSDTGASSAVSGFSFAERQVAFWCAAATLFSADFCSHQFQ
jgi:hypothetical protein